MGRYTGPKEKLSRREGVNLFLKGARSYSDKAGMERKPYPPGQHGNMRKQRLSAYGQRFREKQKIKRIYGVREKQFRNLYLEAVVLSKKLQSNKGEELLRFLELRLDNVVYIGGLAVSRGQARQYVTHKHIVVNGKVVNIPSYRVVPGDVIALREKTLKPDEVFVKEPEWIKRDGMEIEILQVPEREMIDEGLRENLIVEFYSR